MIRYLEVDSQLKPDIELSLIRLGRNHDGGYVVPKVCLKSSQYLLAGGYGNDFSFERAFLSLSRSNQVHLYDYSISFPILIRDLIKGSFKKLLGRPDYGFKYHLRNIFQFFKLKTSSILYFNSKLESDSLNHGVDIPAAIRGFRCPLVDNSIFCKLDIEGSEYELIDGLSESSSFISGLVIEFHDIENRYEQLISALSKLRRDFYLVHNHPNNYAGVGENGIPRVLEITFVSKDLCGNQVIPFVAEYSILDIDQQNDPNSENLVLKFR
jgi:hypothetical protein